MRRKHSEVTDPKEIDQINKSLENGHFLLDRLSEICYNISRDIENKHDYDQPNWSHKQAHNNGKQEILRTIQNILGKHDRPI